ncbi:DNA polymerase type-X family protein pol4-like [Teratosphaeria destructans]|uniref:DNA-directed DNA polymerase n=1 Tax=Teratosphaeria destructans TaxID=418781 RepID=A0A9W7SLZ2_9PEZI|nr:DNA polymerase type-X family protein pol4-like [Teratosphaeria destructans]
MSQASTVVSDGEAPSSQTLQESRTVHAKGKLDLSHLPPMFVSATHIETEDLHELEEELAEAGANLTYDVSEAKIILTKVEKPRRIAFDLRAKGMWTEEVRASPERSKRQEGLTEPAAKRRRFNRSNEVAEEAGKTHKEAIVIDDEITEDEDEADARQKPQSKLDHSSKSARAPWLDYGASLQDDTITAIKVAWFQDSRKAGEILPTDLYTIHRCRRVDRPEASSAKSRLVQAATPTTTKNKAGSPASSMPHKFNDVLERAKEDAENSTRSQDRFGKRGFGRHQPATKDAPWAAGQGSNTKYAHLLQQTTTEHDSGHSSDLPEMPEWVKRGIKYACQRCTPLKSPNDKFIDLLKKIRLARTLTNDEIGVRAYSTSIASLAAYPFRLSSPREILALPGCDAKIANLYVELANTGKIQLVEDLENDEEMKILRLFYEIWGVGATTAREFYFDRGWKDLDDIVEFGWATLSRVQQIGVKYYDEFLDPIPRAEVEEIGQIIYRHAVQVRDDGVQTILVGGYRRGKAACGDVDIIVSHPDESQTLNIINDVIASLEDEGWITHTLLLSLNNSKRNQETLPYRSREGPSGSHGGFDTLDKALVVWQDPHWPDKEAELAANPKAKNKNIHRRVDIIIAPWRTAGCAVVGWSGGTTFERDLRRYAKNLKGWKFDSSGVRDRAKGEVLDLEGFYEYNGEIGNGRAKTLEEAEKRVFEGFGLEYREPWESLRTKVTCKCDMFTMTNMDFVDDAVYRLSPCQIEQVEVGSRMELLAWYTYSGIIWGLKGIVLCTFQRFRLTTNRERLFKVAVASAAVTCITMILTISFGCLPFKQNWQVAPPPPRRCSFRMHDVYVSTVLNITTDLIILAILIPALWAMKVSIWKRTALIFLMGSGSFVMMAALLRVVFVLFRSTSVNLNKWCQRETTVGIIAVSAPVLWCHLRPICRRKRDRRPTPSPPADLKNVFFEAPPPYTRCDILPSVKLTGVGFKSDQASTVIVDEGGSEKSGLAHMDLKRVAVSTQKATAASTRPWEAGRPGSSPGHGSGTGTGGSLGSAGFDYKRDGKQYGLTDEQCSAAFPELYKEINRAVAYRERVGKIAAEEVEVSWRGDGMVRAMIFKNQLYIIEAHGVWDHNHRPRALATLHALNRAITASSERLPNIEFSFSTHDSALLDLGENRTTWSYSRLSNDKFNQESLWLMPDFGNWGWPDVGLRSYTELQNALDADEFEFREKVPQLVWRGSTAVGSKDVRAGLLEHTHDQKWSNVQTLDWSNKTDIDSKLLTMEDHCGYMFTAQTEGNTYSGRLKYLLNCNSVLIAHELNWVEHFHHLLKSSGSSQNYVKVKRDFSDLSNKMKGLLDPINIAATEAIATNARRTFREQYLTPAAEACYWRALIRGWSSVQGFEVQPYERNTLHDDWQGGRRSTKRVRGTPFESYAIMEEVDWALPAKGRKICIDE